MLLAAKSWFIALLLLAFVGQSAVALAMNCELQHQDDASHSTAASDRAADEMEDHSDHNGAGMHHEMPVDLLAVDNHAVEHHGSGESADCCTTVDHCVSGGCSLPALSNQLSIAPILTNTFAVIAYDREYLSVAVSSLYRPPIFR